MKVKLLTLLILILSVSCYSQIIFEKGYYINNSNEKIDCLIKNVGWEKNPTKFTFRLTADSQNQVATIENIKEFEITNVTKYIRETVQIDESRSSANHLKNTKEPIFHQKKLFLKVLIAGDANLYSYKNGALKKYFYNVENSTIKQLIYKEYTALDNKIKKNNKFRQQLWNQLKCPIIKINDIKKVNYRRNDLIKFFIKYNTCNNSNYINYEKKQDRDFLNLTLRPRLNKSSLSLQNTLSNPYNTNFDEKINFGFGVEIEYILPFNKNKWSLTVEPTYQYFKAKKETPLNNLVNLSNLTLTSEIEYSSIEVPISLRHYFFINKNSKIFINFSYLIDINLNSSLTFKREDIGDSGLDINPQNNLAFGLGYKLNNKYSLEIRYFTKRNLLGMSAYWDSSYKTTSLILGYSIF